MDISAQNPSDVCLSGPHRGAWNMQGEFQTVPTSRTLFAGKIWLFDFNLKSNSQLRVSVGISPNFLPESLWITKNKRFFQARIFLRA